MKYSPTQVDSQSIEDLSRHIDEEFSRIADVVTPNRRSYTYKRITADYVASGEPYIFADASSGTVTVSLKAPVDETIHTVKKIDSSANTVIIDGGSNTIDGSTAVTLSSQYDYFNLYWDRTEWWKV